MADATPIAGAASVPSCGSRRARPAGASQSCVRRSRLWWATCVAPVTDWRVSPLGQGDGILAGAKAGAAPARVATSCLASSLVSHVGPWTGHPDGAAA